MRPIVFLEGRPPRFRTDPPRFYPPRPPRFWGAPPPRFFASGRGSEPCTIFAQNIDFEHSGKVCFALIYFKCYQPDQKTFLIAALVNPFGFSSLLGW